MAVPPAPSPRRRARRGSVDRPINGRLYRGTWLLVGLPLLILAFSVARPAALQPPNLPSAFDPGAALTMARALALEIPNRAAGSPGAAAAESWFAQQLTPYGYTVRREGSTAVVPGRGRIPIVNLVAAQAGLSAKSIVVMAHRDDDGTGAGANDNASGTAALIELARAYAPTTGGGVRVRLPYSLLFVSTDGAVDGGLGAEAFAAGSPERQSVVAVINLDGIAGGALPRVEITGDRSRSPSASLVETVRAELQNEAGADPRRASALRQLIDLGFPFSEYEQAPFVARGVPAVTITTEPDRPVGGGGGGPLHLNEARLGQIGRATQSSIDAMEQGIALSPGPSSYLYLGSRIVRGWAIEIVLVAALLPFLAAAVDLFARCRRRRIRIAPALRSYRSRLFFWVWGIALFAGFGALGIWPRGAPRPPTLTHVSWPATGLILLAVLAAVGWLVGRDRLLPRRKTTAEEELAGHAGALLALGVVGLLTVATNPYALIFVLPSLHAWLWLPQVRDRPLATRAGVMLLGFAGPALVLWSFAERYALGLDTPWYVAWLYALRYAAPAGLVVVVAWAAAAGQLAALSVGRYAPYPSAAERPPRGPIRRAIRVLVLSQRRRRASVPQRRALHG